jgi:hypothetical protein
MHTRWPFAVLTIFIAILCLPLQPTPATGSSAIQLLDELGSIGGGTYAIAVSGSTILVGEGTNLVVIDAKPLQQPRLSARLALPGHPLAIVIAGSMAIIKTSAYADGYQPAIQLVDIHDLNRPELWASYNTPTMPAFLGNMIYIGTFDGLHIIDASDPYQPAERGVYTAPFLPSRIALAGSLVVLAESNKLYFFDVHDPVHPVVVAESGSLDTTANLQIQGTLAYVADDIQLQIIDIANPAAPIIRGQIALPNSARALSVVGSMAYVSASRSNSIFEAPQTLLLVDVGTPSTPALRGSYSLPGEIAGIEVVGDMVFVAAKEAGLQIVDSSLPGTPSLRGSYTPPGSVYDLQIIDGLAYLAVDGYGLEIVDLSDPSQPVQSDMLRLIGQVLDVDVAGGLVVVLDNRSLWLVDARQPERLTAVLLVDQSDSLRSMASPWIMIRGSLAYVGRLERIEANQELFLQAEVLILGLGSAFQPTVLGATSIPLSNCNCSAFAQFALVGGSIIVANGSDRLGFIDVSDPTHPMPAGTVYVADRAVEIQAIDRRVYVKGGTNRVSILGIDLLGHSRWLGGYESSGPISAMRAVGSTVYINSETGFEIVDVYDPAAPERIGMTAAPLWSDSIDIVSKRAYLSRLGYGPGLVFIIDVIDISDPAHPSSDGPSIIMGNGVIQFSGTALISISRPRFLSRPQNGYVTVSKLPLLNGGWSVRRELPAPPAGGAVEGGRIYVADAASGMRIYRFYQQTYLPLMSR